MRAKGADLKNRSLDNLKDLIVVLGVPNGNAAYMPVSIYTCLIILGSATFLRFLIKYISFHSLVVIKITCSF